MPFGTAPYVARKPNRRPVSSVPGLNRDKMAPGLRAGPGLGAQRGGLMGLANKMTPGRRAGPGLGAQRGGLMGLANKMTPGPGLKPKQARKVAKKATKVAAKGYRAAMKGKGA